MMILTMYAIVAACCAVRDLDAKLTAGLWRCWLFLVLQVAADAATITTVYPNRGSTEGSTEFLPRMP